jgi:hypothetical protein
MTQGIVGISIQGVYLFSGWLGLRRLHAGGAKTDCYRKAARHSALSSFSSAWKAEENDEALFRDNRSTIKKAVVNDGFKKINLRIVPGLTLAAQSQEDPA